MQALSVALGFGAVLTWSTVGVDENIIAASWHALEEAVTYALLRAGHQPPNGREMSDGE